MTVLYHGTQSRITQELHPRGPLLTLEEVIRRNKSLEKGHKIHFVEGIRAADAKSNRSLDFGDGFYLTEDFDFACLRSCAGPLATSYIYRYNFDEDKLRDRLNIFEFDGPNLQWLLFVAYGRNILTVDMAPKLYNEILDFEHQWDVIIGPTANDRFYGMCKAFLSPTNKYLELNHLMLLDILAQTNISKQTVLKTEKACSMVQELHVKEATPAERSSYEELVDIRAVENVALTDKLYDEAKKNLVHYARNGLNFRDLLHHITDAGYSFIDLQDTELDRVREDETEDFFEEDR